MADYFCTFCGCRHEPLEHLGVLAELARAVNPNKPADDKPLCVPIGLLPRARATLPSPVKEAE